MVPSPAMRLALCAVLAAAMCLPACRFDESLAPGLAVECGALSACPTDFVCDGEAQRCLSALQPFASAPQLSPRFVGSGGVVTVRFTLAPGYGAPVELTVATWPGLIPLRGAAPVLTSGGAAEQVWTYTVAPDEPEGPARVFLSAQRPGGGRASLVALGGFTVDRTPPSATQVSLRFTATEDNLLVAQGVPQALGALGVSTTAQVSLVPSEQLASAAVTARPANGAPFDFDRVSAVGDAQLRFEATLKPGLADGDHPLVARLSDQAGNVSETTLETLRVRTAAPSPIDTSPGRALFRRLPEGDSADPTPRFEVVGRPGAGPERGAVLVLNEDGAIGRAVVRPDGSFGPAALRLRRDLETVDLQFVDAAGNAAPPVGVRDVSLMAVRFRSEKIADVAAPRRPAVPGSALTGRVGAGGSGVSVLGGWRVTPERIQAFSGLQGGHPFLSRSTPGVLCGAGTWWRDGALLIQPCYRVRNDEATAWVDDLSRGLSVYGGALNGNYQSPGVLFPGGPAPPGLRAFAAMAWVPWLGGSVLVGGQAVDRLLGDSWLLSRERWSALPGGVPPRAGHALATDEARAQLVLFGGRGADAGLLGDTWVLADGGWSALPPGPGPSPRVGASMVFDPKGARLILLGGEGASGLLGDTWAFDGTRWSALDAGQLTPRRRAGLAVEPATGALLASGGFGADGGAGVFFDVWELKGDAWAQVPQGQLAGQPEQHPFLTGGAVVWDPDRRRLVAHGGYRVDGFIPCGDCDNQEVTWATSDETAEFDGVEWRAVDAGQLPARRVFHSAAYDPVAKRVVIAGGLVAPAATNVTEGTLPPSSQVFSRSGDGRWQALPDIPKAPAAFSGRLALAFNPLRRQLEVVADREVWTLAPSGWERLDDASAPVQSMLFSPALQRLVAPALFSGGSLLRGFSWGNPLPWSPRGLLVEGPDGLPMSVMRGTISQPFSSEVPAVSPNFASILYPDGPEDYLAHGLSTYGSNQSRYQRRPVVPGVELRAFSSAPSGELTLRRFTTEVWACGAGEVDGGLALGAGLQAFDGRAWRAVAAVSAGDPTPQRLVYEVTDPLAVSLLQQDWRSNAGPVTVTAPGPNGAGNAWLNVVRAQVEVEWRLPSDAGAADGGAP